MDLEKADIEVKSKNEDNNDKKTKPKKVRLFSAQEFQKKLNSTDCSGALKEFLYLCQESNNQDCILEYFQSGGSCMQLLQILEQNSTVHPNTVMEIIYHVVLRVSANYPQYQSSTHEACQYLLNNYITLINKTLGLSSTVNDRKVILKLLTSFVTFSSSLAKDILVHVTFHPGIMDLFIKHTDKNDTVRNAFIHFLTSFLVDGHFPTICALVEKKGLLTSIINGLKYDPANLVCLVLTVMRNHILENPSVSKTTKMKLFSTFVVRDTVNLYNWKGPAGIKRNNQEVIVNEVEKSKVNECVHSFLLTLCTSHKYGVIFKDHMVGLGKKHLNSLMVTVLDGLEKPWGHSYASELVIKICVACPELTKLIWSNLKSYLSPRPTKHWLNAMLFAKNLLEQLDPSCLEFCINELSLHQLAQIIQYLTAPTLILKEIAPEHYATFESSIKFNILKLIKQMLVTIEKFLNLLNKLISIEKFEILRNLIRDHILRNFPNSQQIFNNWNIIDQQIDPIFEKYDALDNLSLILEIFILYEKLSSQLLDDLLINIDPKLFMNLKDFDEDDKKSDVIIKATNLFLNLDSNLFQPNQNLFSLVLPLIFHNYYRKKDNSSKNTLIRLFKLTSIFESSQVEIEIWINAIFGTKNCDNSVVEYILQILIETSKNIINFTDEFNKIKASLDNNNVFIDFDDILELLTGDMQNKDTKIKQNNLSPLILGILQTPSTNKQVKSYINSAIINLFHIQSNPTLFINILLKYDNINLSKNVLNYVLSWQNDVIPLDSFKSKMIALEMLSKSILLNENQDFLKDYENVNLFPGFKLNLLYMCVFYVTNLAHLRKLDENHLNSSLKITKTLLRNDYLHIILNNSNLLQFFEIFPKKQQNYKILCTKYIIEIVKECNSDELVLLSDVREKLYYCLKKILNKPKKHKQEKYENLMQILNAVGLNYTHCTDILNSLSSVEQKDYLNFDFSILYDIILYTLKRFHILHKQNRKLQLLDENTINFLNKYLTYLNVENLNATELTSAFRNYLSDFPHSLQYINSSELFESILNKKEYCKENALLSNLLLSTSSKYLQFFGENIKNICHSKGLILSLLEAAVEQNANKEILQEVYVNFEPSIEKALQKPQKAGVHFDKYYKAVLKLIKDFMPIEKCLTYVKKVHKYETSEIFHVNLLCCIYEKVLKDNCEEKYLNNVILTLIHMGISLLKKKGKTDEDFNKIKIVTNTINNFLRTQVISKVNEFNFSQICDNDTFLSYNKFCLKFGLSGNEFLIDLIRTFCIFLNLNDDYVSLLMDMIISHSDFLEVILNDNKSGKVEILNLIFVLCERWPKVMQKNHIPLLLAAYRATWRRSDRIILSLLKLYEAAAGQTFFYDFKPFLWGPAAANYYSVRDDVQKALWRQPKTGTIIDILQENWITNTTIKYPLEACLEPDIVNYSDNAKNNIYDFSFVLPLFSYLLAPENTVQTYKFCRSGALSLTIAALSSESEEIRSAACYVLFRFYNHLEAKQGGKDKIIFLRLIDAVCKGTAVLKDCKMNNFSSVFFSRMSLILTQPMNVMYVPLSQYLSAKAIPDLSSIPELYTFLHTSEVTYKEQRHFILEIIRDGLRTNQDLKIALKSMAFKLILELFNSNVCDLDSKVIILEILNKACKINKGPKYLCNVHGLMSFLHYLIFHINQSEMQLISHVVKILNNLIKNPNEFFDSSMFCSILGHIIDNYCDVILENDRQQFIEVIYLLFIQNNTILNKGRLKRIIDITNCNDANYLLYYGHKNLSRFFLNNNTEDKDYYIKLLIIKYLEIIGS